MRKPRLFLSLGLVSCLAASVATAGEHARGAEKLKLVSVADSPDPYSAPVAGDLSIEAAFEARPTDGGAGNAKNEKRFAIRVTVEIADQAGETVRELADEFAFQFPEKLPANQYHGVTAVVAWDGKGAAGALVPDGTYTYTVEGTLVRTDVLGNNKIQEHSVGTSGTLSGTVVVDGSTPQLTAISPPPDSYTNDPKPVISGKAVDPASGIDSTTVVLTVDGNAADASFDSATGLVSYTPADDLPQKWIEVVLSASDLAGNGNSVTWSFCEDRSPPVATVVSPADGSWVTVPKPEIAADLADAPAGVDPATVTMQVLEEEVAASYDEVTGRVSYAPETDLPEVEEVNVVVDAADRAGNPVQLAWAVGSDRTPPVISEPSPADGSWVNDALVHVSASYSDATSGVVVSSVTLIVGGDDVTAVAQVTATGVEYAPYDPFDEETVTVSLSVSDEAGHETTKDWSFSVDTIAPVISDLAFGRTPTNNQQEPASAAFSDVGGGVEVGAVVILLDGQDVTYAAEVRTDGFDLVPPAGLTEGTHELEVHISDLAGNGAFAATSVEVDLTPPPAPVVDEVERTKTHVTLRGSSPADVVSIQAGSAEAELESAVIESFTVVFRKVESETFSYWLEFTDEAGNVGPRTVGEEHFLPEVVPLEVTLRLHPDSRTGEYEGVFCTNVRPFLVYGDVSGTPPFQVTVKAVEEGGAEHVFPAQVTAAQFICEVDVPDGLCTMTAEATDSTGASGTSDALQVYVDTVVPELTIAEPAYKTTVGCDCLWLNASGNNRPADEEWPVDVSKRNVLARAGFTVSGTATDSRLPITSARIQTRKDGQVLAYAPATTLTSDPAGGGWEATFSFVDCAMAVKTAQLHQLVIQISDAAGNGVSSIIPVKYDGTYPYAYVVADAELQALRSSPVRFVGAAWDAVTVACEGTEWARWSPTSSLWYSETGVESVPNPSEGHVFEVEDLAGNTGAVELFFDIDPIEFCYPDMEVFRAGDTVWNAWEPQAPPLTVPEGEFWPGGYGPFPLSGWRLDAITRRLWTPGTQPTGWWAAIYQLPRSDESERILCDPKSRLTADGFFPAMNPPSWPPYPYYDAEVGLSAGPASVDVAWWNLHFPYEPPDSKPLPEGALVSGSTISAAPDSMSIGSYWPPGLWPATIEPSVTLYNDVGSPRAICFYGVREHGQAITLRAMPDHVPAEKTTLFIEGWFGEDMAGQPAEVVFVKQGESETVHPTSTRVVCTDFVRRHVSQAILCEVDFSEPAGVDYKGLWNVFVNCGRVNADGDYKKLEDAIVVVEGEGSPPAEEPPPFTLDVPARCCIVVNDDTGIGTSKITLRPFIPGLEFKFEMFDSGATFKDGKTWFTVDTTSPEFPPVFDPDTQEWIWEFEYDVCLPEWEDQCCFNIEIADLGGAKIGEELGINGYPCRAKIEELGLSGAHDYPRDLKMTLVTNCPLPPGDWTKHDLAIPEGPVFVLVDVEQGAMVGVLGGVRPGAFDCTLPPGPIPAEEIDGKHVMVNAKNVPGGEYDVKIGLTLFENVINVTTPSLQFGTVVDGVFQTEEYLWNSAAETPEDVKAIVDRGDGIVVRGEVPIDSHLPEPCWGTFYCLDIYGNKVGQEVHDPDAFSLVKTVGIKSVYHSKPIIMVTTPTLVGYTDSSIVVLSAGGGQLVLKYPYPDR